MREDMYYDDMQPNALQPQPRQMAMQEVREHSNFSMFDSQVSPELVRELIKNHDMLDKIAHLLRGEVWSEEARKWICITRPYGNEAFINDVLLILHTHIDQSAILSNLSDTDVHDITYDIVNRVIELIYYKGPEYQIDKSRRSEIVSIVNNQVYFALRRAFDQGERLFLGKSVSHRENVMTNDHEKQKRSGVMTFLKKGGFA